MSPKPKNSSDLETLLKWISPERFATTMRADFRFAPINVFLLVAIFVIGLIIHLSVYSFSVVAVEFFLGSAIVFAVFLRIRQIWETILILGTLDGLLAYLALRPESTVIVGTIIAAAMLTSSIQMAYQWEKAVLLRFGKFKGLRSSGVFLLMPVIDKVAEFVDQRIRVSDFSAETTLTSDTVPVNVDAIAFWMVWDAEKSVLEVDNFKNAVVLSAQTALRNAIGKHDLAELLKRFRRSSMRRRVRGASPPSRSRFATLSFRRVWKMPCPARPRPRGSVRAGLSSERRRPRSRRSSPPPPITTRITLWLCTCAP
jgi:hypothetical protein